jgi:hypothetical protein
VSDDLTNRSHALLTVRADLAMVRARAAGASLHAADHSTWQALGYVLDGVLRAIDADLGFLLTPQRWTAPPAHVLDLLCELTTAQYQDALRAGALPLLVVAPWDRARTVMAALRTANGALDVDQLAA